MEQPDQNPFPHIEVVSIPERLCRVGRFITGLFQMHQLSEISDHRFEHPFDAELYDKEPVPDVAGREL